MQIVGSGCGKSRTFYPWWRGSNDVSKLLVSLSVKRRLGGDNWREGKVRRDCLCLMAMVVHYSLYCVSKWGESREIRGKGERETRIICAQVLASLLDEESSIKSLRKKFLSAHHFYLFSLSPHSVASSTDCYDVSGRWQLWSRTFPRIGKGLSQ